MTTDCRYHGAAPAPVQTAHNKNHKPGDCPIFIEFSEGMEWNRALGELI
ncbi:hypothetical protein [Rhizobium oryzicola]|uniref:Uncharacterized protein n=1 Tax=Rhizobium oryzicola TaxID=1232668 RepID=A0ABT8SZ51_9HYPH|nr:hypothetical protein [Rhizobium oryzicola]MDO1583693.1 hypothetical protein [Rhizobium oryzicola]